MNKEKKIFVVDTSAFLSGKPLNFDNAQLITSIDIEKEIKSGGKDFHNYIYLKEKGLILKSASKSSLKKIKETSKKTGDIDRLSLFDIGILAIALDENKRKNVEVVLLTDDYSIQNVAIYNNIKFKSVNQEGIIKKFKWINRCLGCRKKFNDNIKICPVCGSNTKKIVIKTEDFDK